MTPTTPAGKIETRGRPKGAVDTPRTILYAQFKENARLGKRIHDILDKLLDQIEPVVLDIDAPVEDKFKAFERLNAGLNAQSTSMERMGKHLITPEEGAPPGDEEATLEAFRKELTGPK